MAFSVERMRAEHLRRMAEPDDIRALRRQAEQIADRRKREVEAFFREAEKNGLRRVIRDAGRQPCR